MSTYRINLDSATTTSEPFHPRGSFVIFADKAVDTGVTIEVQQLPLDLPPNSTNWIAATGNPVSFTGAVRSVSINYIFGFQYRLHVTVGTQATDISFYAGTLASSSFEFLTASNIMIK